MGHAADIVVVIVPHLKDLSHISPALLSSKGEKKRNATRRSSALDNTAQLDLSRDKYAGVVRLVENKMSPTRHRMPASICGWGAVEKIDHFFFPIMELQSGEG
jgi:hypothetical protein